MQVLYVGGPMSGKTVAPYYCDLDYIEVETDVSRLSMSFKRTMYLRRLFVAPGCGEFLAFVHQELSDSEAQQQVSELYFPHNRAARSSALKLA